MEIAEVAARLELRDLADAYATATDLRDRPAWARLFVPDGVFEAYNHAEPLPFVVATGRTELEQVLRHNDAFARTFHVMANQRCRIDGDRATGSVHCLAHHLVEERQESYVMLIRYDDDYARTPDGWRFARRALHFAWTETRPADSSPLQAS